MCYIKCAGAFAKNKVPCLYDIVLRMSKRVNKTKFKVQSEETDTEVPPVLTGGDTTESGTVEFLDNANGDSYIGSINTNSVANVDGTSDISLGDFLARPTLINTTTWTTADLIGTKTTITPWYNFLNNTAIKNKIQNYAFLRGKLRLKIVLNGTPFQYGAMRACYAPLIGWQTSKIRTNPVSALPLAIPYSQQPGVWLYPQANAGAEMTLPFFLHKNWMDITTRVQVESMGTLVYFIYSPLEVAVSSGTTVVTVNTYAWMEDVELMGSSNSLVLQADEYNEGPISKPATALASVAESLTKVPIIGRFARATQIGATAVASMARLFGYTNVPVISDVQAFQPQNAPMLASAHIGIPAQKLTLDPKQELSIDPSVHGAGNVDELALSYILKKESYFGSTSWSTADIPQTQVFNMRISPSLWGQVDIQNGVPATVAKRVYHTPLSYVGGMFKHWRGGMILRMKVVCTKFHKGRLKISYDPRNDISTNNPEENVVYTQIVDIGEQDDVEFLIPYHQDTAWLKHSQVIQDNWTPGNVGLTPRLGVDNGTLTVRVLNELNAPITSAVRILFFIKGANDFEYANPNEHIGPDDTYQFPSFFAVQAEDHTEMLSKQLVFGKVTPPDKDRYGLNYGESITSLRNILHRSVVSDVVNITIAENGTYAYRNKAYKIMPYAPGFISTFPTNANKIITAGTQGYAYNTMTHMCYIASMYLGYRGGATYTVTPGIDSYGELSDFRVYRMTRRPPNYTTSRYIDPGAGITLATATTSSLAAYLGQQNSPQNGLSGMAITATNTNGSIVFNIPDYKFYNFSLADPSNYFLGSPNDDTDNQGAMLRFIVKAPLTANKTGEMTLQSEVAAGPDFTCLFFLCCPTLDYALTVPVPV